MSAMEVCFMVLHALYSGFAQHVAPSPGASPHSRPQGTVLPTAMEIYFTL
ncbi:hypothetical protein [Pseudomonas aeruginosa]|nr:hypothetical protein [Pseudomonas aeruginosa]